MESSRGAQDYPCGLSPPSMQIYLSDYKQTISNAGLDWNYFDKSGCTDEDAADMFDKILCDGTPYFRIKCDTDTDDTIRDFNGKYVSNDKTEKNKHCFVHATSKAKIYLNNSSISFIRRLRENEIEQHFDLREEEPPVEKPRSPPRRFPRRSPPPKPTLSASNLRCCTIDNLNNLDDYKRLLTSEGGLKWEYVNKTGSSNNQNTIFIDHLLRECAGLYDAMGTSRNNKYYHIEYNDGNTPCSFNGKYYGTIENEIDALVHTFVDEENEVILLNNSSISCIRLIGESEQKHNALRRMMEKYPHAMTAGKRRRRFRKKTRRSALWRAATASRTLASKMRARSGEPQRRDATTTMRRRRSMRTKRNRRLRT